MGVSFNKVVLYLSGPGRLDRISCIGARLGLESRRSKTGLGLRGKDGMETIDVTLNCQSTPGAAMRRRHTIPLRMSLRARHANPLQQPLVPGRSTSRLAEFDLGETCTRELRQGRPH